MRKMRQARDELNKYHTNSNMSFLDHRHIVCPIANRSCDWFERESFHQLYHLFKHTKQTLKGAPSTIKPIVRNENFTSAF